MDSGGGTMNNNDIPGSNGGNFDAAPVINFITFNLRGLNQENNNNQSIDGIDIDFDGNKENDILTGYNLENDNKKNHDDGINNDCKLIQKDFAAVNTISM